MYISGMSSQNKVGHRRHTSSRYLMHFKLLSYCLIALISAYRFFFFTYKTLLKIYDNGEKYLLYEEANISFSKKNYNIVFVSP